MSRRCYAEKISEEKAQGAVRLWKRRI